MHHLRSLARRTVALTFAIACCCAGSAAAQPPPFTVSANVALSSLIAISDGHLEAVADSLQTLAATPAAQSGDWSRIQRSMHRLSFKSAAAFLYFARPDGSYLTLAGGAQSANLADRPYFKAAMSGRVSIGDLVFGRSTKMEVAIVAVPVSNAAGKVTGVIAASVPLAALSRQIAHEMQLDANDLFWAIDSHGTIALHSAPSAIFEKPGTQSPEGAARMARMQSSGSGTETYRFHGQMRTVIYRRSPVSGWIYGFGVLH